AACAVPVPAPSTTFMGRGGNMRGAAPRRARHRQPRLLPSRLSRSVPESHRVHLRVAREGSRTVTAGGESHPAPETSYLALSIRGSELRRKTAPSLREPGGRSHR